MAAILTKLLGKTKYQSLTVKQLDQITAAIDEEINASPEIAKLLEKRVDKYRK